MKLNRKMVMVLALVLSVAMATSGTMAYLSDTDSDVNVMTLGSVEIEQHEKMRSENGLIDFKQNQPMMPVTATPGTYMDENGQEVTSHSSEYKFLAVKDGEELKNVPNVVDKIVTVENTGKSDAYVRTIFAFEVAESVAEVKTPGTDIGLMRNDAANTDDDDTTLGNSDWSWDWLDEVVTIDNQKYAIAVATHNAILPKGETTIPSLLQVYLKSHVDNDYVSKLGDSYNVLVLSQAVQADGFADAETALNAGFPGVDSTETIVKWFGDFYPVNEVEPKDLAAALNNAGAGTTIKTALEEDFNGSLNIGEDVGFELDLGNNTLNGSLINNGGNVSVSDGTLVSPNAGIESIDGNAKFENVDVNAGSPANYSVIIRGADSAATFDNADIVSAGGGVGARGAEVTFNSGSIAVNSTSTSGRYVFYAEGEGTVININGGEFSFSKTLNQKRAYIYASEGTTVNVSGGTFGKASTRSGYTAGILGNGKVVITGGTFGFDPSNWVADGYEAVKTDDSWTVKSK